MRLLIAEAAMPSPQGRFYDWLTILKITKQNGEDFFDPACIMSDDEELRLLPLSTIAFEDEYE